MSLAPGAHVGPYEVLGALGAGGMGEVYRARDHKLGRDVALKILPSEFAGDPERLTRFRREAQMLAALSHPHIATLHGIEDTTSTTALVMEVVDGVTLQQRLQQVGGPMPLDEALAIARQIALALEAAHERGIIHRDLKPANIKLREDGVVKVLDFGLAKAVAEVPVGDIDNSPTVTTPALTGLGVLFGTAAYMSPEQARGTAVDKRADIWAFGVVLYEMLAGRPLFTGASTTDLIAHLLTKEPEWAALPPDLPATVRTLVKRCLTKDQHKRLRDIGDARIALDEAAAPGLQEEVAQAPVLQPARSRWTRAWPIAAAALFGAVAGFVVAFSRQGEPVAAPLITTRTTIAMPPTETLPPARTMTLALSPDGRRLIYKADVGGISRLFLRDMNLAGEASMIPGTERADSFAFSPDGTWAVVTIGRGSEVKKIPLAGGTPITLCRCAAETGAYWAPDGFIYLPVWHDKRWRLRRTPESGGRTTDLPVPKEYDGKQLTHPAPLPGGRRLLVVVSDPDRGAVVSPAIAAYDLDTHAVTPLVPRGTSPRYLSTGHLLFTSGAVLFAVPFDAATLRVSGEPAPLIQHVTNASRFAHGDYAVADAASMLVYTAAPFIRGRVVRVRGSQAPEPVLEPQGYLDIAISQDGQQLAVTIDPRGIAALPSPDEMGIPYLAGLYTREIAMGDLIRRADSEVRRPVFLPGGTRLAYGAGPAAERAIRLGESPSVFDTLLPGTDRFPFRPSSISPDGRRLAYDHNGNLFVIPLESGAKPERFLGSQFEQQHPDFSPDGRWIAYDLDDGQGGRAEVWVRPYPQREPAIQISTGGGSLPRWSRDGKRIYFVGNARLMAADVSAGPAFKAATPREIAPQVAGVRSFALAPDSQTFYAIVNEHGDEVPKRDITVVTGWREEVRRLVTAGAR